MGRKVRVRVTLVLDIDDGEYGLNYGPESDREMRSWAEDLIVEEVREAIRRRGLPSVAASVRVAE